MQGATNNLSIPYFLPRVLKVGLVESLVSYMCTPLHCELWLLHATYHHLGAVGDYQQCGGRCLTKLCNSGHATKVLLIKSCNVSCVGWGSELELRQQRCFPSMVVSSRPISCYQLNSSYLNITVQYLVSEKKN